ncbi:LuxR C-terminal-related transcriptional regulator [Streptomyces sp. HNM0663]|uniref:LuxR C-terminal-related transcriptional regulator n=1 Tax=Streptomyces chengmaiensis TaxID=3040919 RepID=A0ABT6HHW9_9ACTN|nr:LuxR family transcriptional regulator [Streptomyces chengmaiensis]MDH2387880.1 LuxR C-terminal-related transcriptional regulator [Streptomyces chengmaiensis]
MTGARRSKVLLVEAAPGAGKTRLLLEAAAVAGRNGFAVVNGVPATPDATPKTAPATAGTHAHAPGAAEGGFHSPSTPSAIEAVRAWLRNAQENVRAVVVLDDLHLANLPTLTALCDLVAAVRGRPILWLLAFTPDRDTMPYDPVQSCLAKLRGRLPVEPLHPLGPLSGDALKHLVADCTGAAPGPVLLALAESVNSTPGTVLELLRGLMDDGDICIVDGASRLQPGLPGSAPARVGVCVPASVPERFSALIQQDLRSLSEPTLRALRLAAVLGSPFTPEDLSAMLGEAPVGLLAAVDEAVGRGLLVCGEHDLAFRTEPIWRALLDSVPPPVRAMLRRQAAEMLLSRPDGVERAALQLVHIAQPCNVRELRIIADGAQRLLAADPSAAASLAARCMELAPGQADRVRLAKTAVEAFTRAGALDRAITLARDTIDEAARLAAPLPAALAEDIAALRGASSTALLLQGNAQSARRAARDALAAHACGFRSREAVITRLAASYLTGDGAAAELARKILSAPDRHPQAVHAGALIFEAFGQWRDGRVGGAVGTLRKAVALGRPDEDAQLLDPRWFLAFALTRTGEYDEAAAAIQPSARTAAPAEGTLAAAVAGVLRAPLHLAQGRLDDAEEAARTGVGMDGPYVPVLAPQAWLVLAHVALRRGALTQAEDHIKTLEKDFPQPGSSPWQAARLLLSAQLAEARADECAAAQALAEIGAHADGLRLLVLEDPAAAAWCVRSALAADLPDLARTVVDTTERLRRHNRDVPAVLAAAAHARALAEGDVDALARAGRQHRSPWARAAAVEDHAGLLLDGGDHEGAISGLDRAMSAYGALGGERDAARVRARLRRLGVRRRHWTHAKRPVSGWESLTKTELKVAELVADGLTNQQTARHLFISPHTVGFHLRQIYRKLGIRSRTALVRLKA